MAATPGDYKGITAFSFIPLYIPAGLELGVDWIKTMEDYIIAANFMLKDFTGVEANLSMDGVTEITEDEFYKID